MKRLLIIDNFDSFTHNLAHYCEDLGVEVVVKRNNQVLSAEVEHYDGVILSPGPGLPKDAGVTMHVLEDWAGKKPILGVCLGLQAIVEHFGGRLRNLPQVLHGVSSRCEVVHKHPVFEGISSPFLAGHYHSWVMDESYLPENLKVIAVSGSLIMAVNHTKWNVFGVQFHPESVMTPQGKQMLSNWISRYL
ncbi:MAG: anthranilate synthase, component [Bacteroidota bacterium]|jgi:anthranilate synthase component 2